MNLKDLFKKDSKAYVSIKTDAAGSVMPNVPDGLYTKCSYCHEMVLTEDLYANSYICPKCGRYHRMTARKRIEMVCDPDTFEEWDIGMDVNNPCGYDGYEEKVENLRKNTGLDEAVITGKGKINGREAVIGVSDTRFLMGSMGFVVGEKIARAVEKATQSGLPVIMFTCSGGARMQEGIVSLMQMAKTSAALKKHDEAGGLYISVLTDPTTGGVTASFAMLGDIILAEPGALIGFAGPRVIKQTIGQELPKGFQRSEFLLSHGFVDAVVNRTEMRETLGRLLKVHARENLRDSSARTEMMKRYLSYLDDIYAKKIDIEAEEQDEESNDFTPWERVEIARSSERPNALDYIEHITKDFFELHGDRLFQDDKSIIGGIAMFGKQPVTVIGNMKGKSTKENITCNFGMANPEGYRKALRLMKQAEKFNRPVICFVDTPGAYPGIGAEERGQGEAIARNLYEMSSLKVPVLSIVTGEGGSGGALALAVANEVWMMENAVYSVLSPEGFASILWKDSSRAKEAAAVMKMTASELKQMGVIERVIPEYPRVSDDNINRVTINMKRKIAAFLIRYMERDKDELAAMRYERFRNIGTDTQSL